MSSLEQEKQVELQEVQEELRSAQEEVLLLQQAAEEAAAERENDIACLQEELCRLRAELQCLLAAASQSELEMSALRAEISGRGLQGHTPPPGRRRTLVARHQSPDVSPRWGYHCSASLADLLMLLHSDPMWLSGEVSQLTAEEAGPLTEPRRRWVKLQRLLSDS